MLVVSIVTAFPALYSEFLSISLLRLAQERGLVRFNLIKFSDQCAPKEPIDEPTVGPGPGMILKPDVVANAIERAFSDFGKGYVIFFTPQGRVLDQRLLEFVADRVGISSPIAVPADQHIVLVCSRYEGCDARVEAFYADLRLSIGDYVLMGGDLPAQVFLEGFLRLLPGIVGNKDSVVHDSFGSELLDHDEFGLPVEWRENRIPDVLRSGDHGKIKTWRERNALLKTLIRRFDWFRKHAAVEKLILQAREELPRHYVALMHSEVLVKSGEVGTTSVTSIDLHDIARTSQSYGIEQFFAVTPLIDQIEIVKTFVEFWRSGIGGKLNATRNQSTSRLALAQSFDEVLKTIAEREGKPPLVITTSARVVDGLQAIDFYDQEQVWSQGRPVLFVFGTGQGLAPSVLDRGDYLLPPVRGMTNYNHLSVRSAVAIILDRWMGMNKRKS
jgi:tRNA (guanine37-N1)-methyltransferase